MPENSNNHTIINIDQPSTDNPSWQDDQSSVIDLVKDLGIVACVSTVLSMGVVAIAELIKNFSEQDNSRRTGNDSSINPNLTYLVFISPIAGLIGASIISAKYYLKDRKITDIRQKINALCDISLDQDRSTNIQKFSEICEDINEKKLGNYLFTTLVNSLMRIAPENLDFVNDCLDIAIPRIHEVPIANLSHNDHKSLRTGLVNLIIARDSNLDQSKYTTRNQDLLSKARNLFANKDNLDFLIGVIDPNYNEISTKDLFLIYALSNSKNFIDPLVLSRLVHDSEYRQELNQIISGGLGFDANRNYTIENRVEISTSAITNVSGVSAQLTSGETLGQDPLARLFVVGGSNHPLATLSVDNMQSGRQESSITESRPLINSSTNPSPSINRGGAIVQSSTPAQRVIILSLNSVNSISSESNSGVIPI